MLLSVIWFFFNRQNLWPHWIFHYYVSNVCWDFRHQLRLSHRCYSNNEVAKEGMTKSLLLPLILKLILLPFEPTKSETVGLFISHTTEYYSWQFSICVCNLCPHFYITLQTLENVVRSLKTFAVFSFFCLLFKQVDAISSNFCSTLDMFRSDWAVW